VFEPDTAVKPKRLMVYAPDAASDICASMLKDRKVILYGADGVGRTELMVRVLDRLLRMGKMRAGDYRVLNYVESFTETAKANAPPEIAEENAISTLYDLFAREGKFVFADNIDKTVLEDSSLCYLLGLKNVLITASGADVLGKHDGDFVKYEIALPDERECRHLFDDPDSTGGAYNPFRRFAARSKDEKEFGDYVFDTLYRKTAGHPMALRLADKFGEAMGYYNIIDRISELDIDMRGAISSREAFGKIIDLYLESDACDDEQRRILRLFSLMPYRMLREADIASVTGGKCSCALSRLASVSLIQSHQSRGGGMYYAIHPIIAEAIRANGIDIELCREIIYDKLQTKLSELPGDGLCRYAWMTQLVKSAAMYYMHDALGRTYDDSLRAALFSCLGTIFRKRGSADKNHYERAKTWLNRALDIQERLAEGKTPPRARFDLAVTLCNLGEIYLDGEPERARDLQEWALELKRGIRDPSIENIALHVAKSCAILAETLRRLYRRTEDDEDLKKAFKLQAEAVSLLERYGGAEAGIELADIYEKKAEEARDNGNMKLAIYHQLTARDCVMRTLEAAEPEKPVTAERAKPRNAGFECAVLNHRLVNVCEQLSDFYFDADEYGLARFYKEFVNRERSGRERVYGV
jgi:hypothetical protein